MLVDRVSDRHGLVREVLVFRWIFGAMGLFLLMASVQEAGADDGPDDRASTTARRSAKSGPPDGRPVDRVGPPEQRRARPKTGAKSKASAPDKPQVGRPVPRPAPTSRTAPVRVRPDVAPRDPTRRLPSQSHSAIQRSRVRVDPPASGAVRRYDTSRVVRVSPPHRTTDHRYARPHYRSVKRSPYVRYRIPARRAYATRYTHWWIHPYYRHYRSCSVVVAFPFYVHPWTSWWVPPARPGWVWVPGYRAVDWWVPGTWRPVREAPVVRSTTFVWVGGWWQSDVYIEGYWRVPARGPDWIWVDGRYVDDGSYVPGHWRPTDPAPAGYTWEPGFWDGEEWVEGFWRPRVHEGYVWVPAHFDEDGIHHMGFWEPEQDRPGYVWVPGWFDGTAWVPGEWVDEDTYRNADVESWEPPEGWHDGWDDEAGEDDEELPLALPAEP